jgi:hypothetical protein
LAKEETKGEETEGESERDREKEKNRQRVETKGGRRKVERH